MKGKYMQKYKVLLWQLTMWMLRLNSKGKRKEDRSFGIHKKWEVVDRQKYVEGLEDTAKKKERNRCG